MVLLSSFPTMFSILSRTNFKFSVTFILLSANGFNFDQAENLWFGRELMMLGKKAFSDKNLNSAHIIGFVYGGVENIVRKGENCFYYSPPPRIDQGKQFLAYPFVCLSSKTFTMAIAFKLWVIKLSYFTYIFLGVKPFFSTKVKVNSVKVKYQGHSFR